MKTYMTRQDAHAAHGHGSPAAAGREANPTGRTKPSRWLLPLIALLLAAPGHALADEAAATTSMFVVVEPGTLAVSSSPVSGSLLRVVDTRGGGVAWTMVKVRSIDSDGSSIETLTVA